MLWYRAWLETRYRFLIALALLALFAVPLRYLPAGQMNGVEAASISAAYVAAWMSLLFAGAGIGTQSMRKGQARCVLFTLALPVSRLRLLISRAVLGWFEMTVGLGVMLASMWTLIPVIRENVKPADMSGYAITMLACASGLYAINLLLSALFDDAWRVYLGMALLGVLAWIPVHVRVPDAMNLFGAIVGKSPFVTHSISWISVSFSMELAVILVLASWKIAQWREY